MHLVGFPITKLKSMALEADLRRTPTLIGNLSDQLPSSSLEPIVYSMLSRTFIRKYTVKFLFLLSIIFYSLWALNIYKVRCKFFCSQTKLLWANLHVLSHPTHQESFLELHVKL